MLLLGVLHARVARIYLEGAAFTFRHCRVRNWCMYDPAHGAIRVVCSPRGGVGRATRLQATCLHDYTCLVREAPRGYFRRRVG